MIRNNFLWTVTFCLCVFVFAVEATEIPPIPKGYADDQAVRTAILLGQIKLINATNISIPNTVEEMLNIQYGTGGERTLHLDMYLPKGRQEATPAIIFIHGGASPLFHLTRNDPPTLIFRGTIDSTVPIVQADKLADKLKELGIDYIYERYDGWPHVMDLAAAVNRRCVYQMEQFFKKCFSID